MQLILDIVHSDGPYVLRLLVATVLGGLVGLERQKRGRSAGLRTNILVCLGSAGVVVAFQKLSGGLGLDAESVVRLDPARAAAGVITGIGFLGAGTIVKSKDFVRGLTTAASIWVVSAVGVTVGLGQYPIAIALTALVLVTLYFLHHLPMQTDRYATVRLSWVGELGILSGFEETLRKRHIQINHRSITRQPKLGQCRVTLYVQFREKSDSYEAFGHLQDDQRLDEVSWS